MMKRIIGLKAVVLYAVLFVFTSAAHAEQAPWYPGKYMLGAKYVFFFIADGTGDATVMATENYLATLDNPNLRAHHKLAFSQLPVRGQATTYSTNSYITDSAASGTALACGVKTNSGVIAMDPSGTIPYVSLATLAKLIFDSRFQKAMIFRCTTPPKEVVGTTF